MKFDFVIGNPPYQENKQGNERANPIYDKFMEEAFKVAKAVELITPARFLFEAGQTSKEWNKKCLMTSILRYCIMNPILRKYFQIQLSWAGWQSHIEMKKITMVQ